MPKTCTAANCTRPVWGKGYCRNHQYLRTDKKQKPIKPFSAKRTETNKLYNARAALFIATHKKCQINSPVCTVHSQHVHHIKGRGEELMNQAYWLAACDHCNLYVEDHHAWAVENGFKISRHCITPLQGPVAHNLCLNNEQTAIPNQSTFVP